jgi:adenine-specific DNA-methyltransferase
MERIEFGVDTTRPTEALRRSLTSAIAQCHPGIVQDGEVDLEVLASVLGASAGSNPERYGLSWNGKRAARAQALTPPHGTLRPMAAESLDWHLTQNVFIEGDNLETLKLLGKSLFGKVSLIYIDPPYNTGKDFVYYDDFRDPIGQYRAATGQTVDGRVASSNQESGGRFHTNWLNMMLPRLVVSRSLLKKNGAIFMSIDDCELPRLRMLCDEVFGEENFVGCAVWQKKYSPQNDAQHLSELHEYVLGYARDAAEWRARLLPRTEEARQRYKNPDGDPRGDWKAGDLSTKTKAAGHSYPITGPTGKVFMPPTGRQWGPSLETFNRMLSEGRVWFGEHGENVPSMKQFLTEVQDGTVPTTLWLRDEVGDNQAAVRELKSLGIPFDSPKPTTLLRHLLKIATSPSEPCIVLDFFAGSGTTGHAVLLQNAEDGGQRRFITVQLPEPVSETEVSQRDAAAFCKDLGRPSNLAEITKQRLRLSIARLKADQPLFAGDLGFRVYKLDSSNVRAWEPVREDLEATLIENAEHIRADRTEQDIIYELVLKLGLDLCVPIEEKSIAGKVVHSIGSGALLACLAIQIAREEVEPLANGIIAWHDELSTAGGTTCVFRDSAFADDVAKTNLSAILAQHGLNNVRSL